jgi:N-acetylneuraminic acid mutarotase
MRIAIFLLLISTQLFSMEHMTFLVEDQNGKHVGLSSDYKQYELLTNDQNWNLYPSLSEDGKQIAFVKGTSDKDLSLVVMDRVLKSERVLTRPGFILQPKFAKRAEMIFFSRKVNNLNQIGFIELNKTRPGQLAQIQYIKTSVDAFFPAPFQSGEMIVYQRNNNPKEIVLHDLIKDEVVVIGHGMSPSLSKDEKYIAFTSKVNNNWDIYVYDRFNKTIIKVTDDSANDFSPSFDRDNNLIYSSDRNEAGVYSIFKQAYHSWQNQLKEEELLIGKKGVSFYAPHASGLSRYLIDVMPAMIGETRSSFGAINHQNHLYIVGGHQGAEHTYPPESFTGRVTSYDIKAKVWLDKASRLHPSHGFQLASYQNFVFAFGGFAYEENNYPKWKSISIVERYNPQTDSWEEMGHMPRNRSSNVAMKINDKVYLIGGWDATPKYYNDIDGTFHDEIDVYDLKRNTWSTLATRLPKKRRAFSAFVKDGLIYMAGGISEGGSHFSLLDDFTVFDPITETFSELPKLPFATFAPAAGTLGNEAYIFGGMFKTGAWEYEYIPHVYKFDFTSQKWEHTGRYLKESKGFSQVVEFNNCLGIMGGHSYQNNSDRPLATFEKFCLTSPKDQ